MHNCSLAIYFFDTKVGGVPTASRLLGTQLMNKYDVIYHPIELSLVRKIGSNVSQFLPFEFKRLIIRHFKPSKQSQITDRSCFRIFTHPSLALLNPGENNCSILWYHDSWEFAKRIGHADQIRKLNPLLFSTVFLSEGDSLFASREGMRNVINIFNPILSHTLGTTSRDKKFVMLTRHSKQKAIHKAILAWKLSKLSDQNYVLAIYGKGALKSLNLAFSKLLRVKNVEFHNHTDSAQDILATARGLVSSSIHEGMPLIFLEAIAKNTPFITFNSSPGCEELANYFKGFDLLVNSTLELSKALDRIATIDSEEENRFRELCREFYMTHNLSGWNRAWRKLLDSYEHNH